eukprot:5060376-Alexandrium_andersonii.AAC.1
MTRSRWRLRRRSASRERARAGTSTADGLKTRNADRWPPRGTICLAPARLRSGAPRPPVKQCGSGVRARVGGASVGVRQHTRRVEGT